MTLQWRDARPFEVPFSSFSAFFSWETTVPEEAMDGVKAVWSAPLVSPSFFLLFQGS